MARDADLERDSYERALAAIQAEIDEAEADREAAHEAGDYWEVVHLDDVLDGLYAELDEFVKNPF